MNFLKKQRITSNMLSILAIIIGTFLLIYPHETKLLVCYTLGGVLALVGLLKLLVFFINRAEYRKNDDMVSGILLSTLGSVLIIKSNLLINIYPIIVGCILIVKSAFALSDALDYKKTGIKDWWIDIVLLLITAALGIVLIILDENKSGNLIAYLTGASLIIDGVFSLLMTFSMHNKTRHIKRDVENYLDDVVWNEKKEEEMKK